ncbi:MAG: DUF6263 family protein [Prevotellaceae bacterium]|nr:DUF6263 family protein [Prevotellaceae bacterium]
MKHLILKTSILGLVFMSVLFSCDNKDKITLQYSLKQGETFSHDIVMNVDMVQKIANKDVKNNLVVNMKRTFEVKENHKDSCTLEGKYREWKIEGSMPLLSADRISFDSNTAENIATPANLSPALKAVIGKPFEIVLTKTGKVRSVKGMDKLTEASMNAFDDSVPVNTRKQMLEQFGVQFSDEAFKTDIESNTYFPDKPVGTGDSWDVSTVTTASNFIINSDLKSTLKSIEDNTVTLYIEGTVSTPEGYEQDVNGVKTKVTLKGTQKGTLKISKDTGWIISSDMMVNFNGSIELLGVKAYIYCAIKMTLTDK